MVIREEQILKQRRKQLKEAGITAESLQQKNFMISEIARKHPHVYKNFEEEIKKDPEMIYSAITHLKTSNIEVNVANVLAYLYLPKKQTTTRRS